MNIPNVWVWLEETDNNEIRPLRPVIPAFMATSGIVYLKTTTGWSTSYWTYIPASVKNGLIKPGRVVSSVRFKSKIGYVPFFRLTDEKVLAKSHQLPVRSEPEMVDLETYKASFSDVWRLWVLAETNEKHEYSYSDDIMFIKERLDKKIWPLTAIVPSSENIIKGKWVVTTPTAEKGNGGKSHLVEVNINYRHKTKVRVEIDGEAIII